MRTSKAQKGGQLLHRSTANQQEQASCCNNGGCGETSKQGGCSPNNNNDCCGNDYDAEMMTPMLKQQQQQGTASATTTTWKRSPAMSRRFVFNVLAGMVVMAGLTVSVLGLPFPDRTLPALDPLPAAAQNRKRAFATLHSDSNPCYDMLLYVCLYTWKQTNSQYPMLVLHSVPLPDKVEQLIATQTSTTNSNAGQIIAVSIPERKNRFVVKDRVRSAAAKFAAWDQTDYDQLAYHDSDFVFFENGDSIFDAPMDKTGNQYLYALPYQKYWNKGAKIFNSGNFLLRPDAAVSRKILSLFQRRFWILSFQQFLKTADQGFLNAVFSYGKWDVLDPAQLHRVKHVKFWLALEGDAGYNVTQEDQAQAKQIAETLKLHDDLEECLHHRRYSN